MNALRIICRFFVITILLLSTSLSFAVTEVPPAGDINPFSPNQGMDDLKKYLLNLGQYLGFNLGDYPGEGDNPPTVSHNLLVAPAAPEGAQQVFTDLVECFLSALPIATPNTFIVPDTAKLSGINIMLNRVFNLVSYSSPSPDKVAASALIDQPNYQADPVSQAVLNILTTPENSYFCANQQDCPPNKVQGQLIARILGITDNGENVPGEYAFYSFDFNKALVSQLNANSLLGPLLYSQAAASQNNQSENVNAGLTAKDSAQEAANFVRYASSLVIPFKLPSQKEYSDQLRLLNDKDATKRFAAQATLATMLVNLRVVAAQSSVALGNLYSIFAKRMPIDSTAGEKTSQALTEFNMATRRLYNPDKSQAPWISQINKAAPATVQKEMASLLAEINYQLYLNRQQQERILLTESLLLMQNTKASQLTTTPQMQLNLNQ